MQHKAFLLGGTQRCANACPKPTKTKSWASTGLSSGFSNSRTLCCHRLGTWTTRLSISTRQATSLWSRKVHTRTTGMEKHRCTAMLAVMADGQKLPPYVIFERKTLPKGNCLPGVHVQVQEEEWTSADLKVDWIKTVWGGDREHFFSHRSSLSTALGAISWSQFAWKVRAAHRPGCHCRWPNVSVAAFERV